MKSSNYIYIAPGSNPHSLKYFQYVLAKSSQPKVNIIWISFEPFDKKFINKHKGNINNINLFQVKTLINLFFFSLKLLFTKVKYKIIVQSLARYLLPLILLKIKNYPLILYAWGSDIYYTKRLSIAWLLQKIYLKKAKFLVCDSFDMREKLIQKDVNPKKIKLVFFGTDTALFSRDSDKYLLGNNQNIQIISSRNHESIYNLETVLYALEKLSKKGVNFKAIFLGSGTLTHKYKEIISQSKYLDPKKIIFTGKVGLNEMIRFLKSSDIYISSALSDAGLASSTAEAMSCGTIPLVSDVRENSIWVNMSLKTGFLFKARDTDDLLKTILHLLSLSPKEKYEISENASNLVKKKLSRKINDELNSNLLNDL